MVNKKTLEYLEKQLQDALDDEDQEAEFEARQELGIARHYDREE
jgi:hypothetical protein